MPTKLAAALVIGSILTGALRAYWLLLSPNDVLHGAVWQPLTYGFIATSPLEVVFGAVILVSIGGTLEGWWGSRRLLWFLLGVTVASGVVTTLLALGFPSLRHAYFAGSAAMVSAAWCVYGWSLGRSLVSFWGVTVTGNQLAAIGIGMVGLHAAYSSPSHVIPEVVAIALAYAHVRRRR